MLSSSKIWFAISVAFALFSSSLKASSGALALSNGPRRKHNLETKISQNKNAVPVVSSKLSSLPYNRLDRRAALTRLIMPPALVGISALLPNPAFASDKIIVIRLLTGSTPLGLEFADMLVGENFDEPAVIVKSASISGGIGYSQNARVGMIVLDYENKESLLNKLESGPYPLELRLYNPNAIEEVVVEETEEKQEGEEAAAAKEEVAAVAKEEAAAVAKEEVADVAEEEVAAGKEEVAAVAKADVNSQTASEAKSKPEQKSKARNNAGSFDWDTESEKITPAAKMKKASTSTEAPPTKEDQNATPVAKQETKTVDVTPTVKQEAKTENPPPAATQDTKPKKASPPAISKVFVPPPVVKTPKTDAISKVAQIAANPPAASQDSEAPFVFPTFLKKDILLGSIAAISLGLLTGSVTKKEEDEFDIHANWPSTVPESEKPRHLRTDKQSPPPKPETTTPPLPEPMEEDIVSVIEEAVASPPPEPMEEEPVLVEEVVGVETMDTTSHSVPVESSSVDISMQEPEIVGHVNGASPTEPTEPTVPTTYEEYMKQRQAGMF
uniref:Uncharacterized protein n=1 Tax=Ditylum brightwellii TaxID=49249 RepID=A0A6V2GED9_9STRA|mmetsp:Transcript_3883/g.5149  ORF Transcript_3883/g.5149 Transcript_3883/m.5149 type:complete len:555 (+) Transcript_3883:111-1775(+)